MRPGSEAFYWFIAEVREHLLLGYSWPDFFLCMSNLNSYHKLIFSANER